MIIRIVKMTFQTSLIKEFEELFSTVRKDIQEFNGCEYLELWQDQQDPRIFFTYSKWSSESDLNQYRNSSFFKLTWEKTNVLFEEPAEAWSVSKKWEP